MTRYPRVMIVTTATFKMHLYYARKKAPRPRTYLARGSPIVGRAKYSARLAADLVQHILIYIGTIAQRDEE